MVGKTRRIRLLSWIVAAAMLLSVTAAAVAAPATDVIDAKDDIATVDITQVYNNTETDAASHNYATDGSEVDITYRATLRMTEEMAIYLQARQRQLMEAQFTVKVNMDMTLLEFTGQSDTLTVVFSSSFLKPQDVEGDPYSSRFLGRSSDGIFSYEISVDRAWAEAQPSFEIPMELIVYFDGTAAYGYDAAKESFANEPLMYSDFTVQDWLEEIEVEIAELRVKDSVRQSVTYDPITWKTVKASGTVDGTFSYIGEPANTIQVLKNYEEAGYVTTLEFGNEYNNDPDDDPAIEEWTSNEVLVQLIREVRDYPVIPGQPVEPVAPDSPYLNLEDHFAYIIGYPVDYVTGQPTDDMSRWPVKPEGTITRAEVATIFFRMLTDEVRNEYWSQTNPYTDVQAADWYNNAISTLTNLGVIEGYPDGTFLPNGNITRAEFATMAVRFFIITEEYTWNEDAFSDIAGHWANEYINLAYLLSIVNGYPDGTFKPQNAITRAEAMTIVNNTLRRSPVKEGLLPVKDMIVWPDNMDDTAWYYAEVQEATNSHEYTYVYTLNGEQWTKELPVRDWAAFEREWSNANSAANPGEVVDGN